MADWQDISTAPKDGTLIDIWIGRERRTDVCWRMSEDQPHREWWCARELTAEWHEWGWCNLGQEYSVAPTHWMPLPRAPAV